MVKSAEVKRENVWTKDLPKQKLLKELPQVPGTRKSVSRDAARKARVPGKRLSRTGKVYWETRANRSDLRGTNL